MDNSLEHLSLGIVVTVFEVSGFDPWLGHEGSPLSQGYCTLSSSKLGVIVGLSSSLPLYYYFRTDTQLSQSEYFMMN